tara:strand:- start:175 stop:645 length:471 start_codon:yes stop_codon:yes gene_type:complete
MQKLILVLLVIVVAVVAVFVLTGSDTQQSDTEQTDSETIDNQGEDEDDTEIETALTGRWQSTTDVNSYKIFSADGSVIERYEGETTVESEGSWEVFSTNDPVSTIEAPLDPAMTYLRISEGGEQYHYLITTINETDLELVYLDRGGVLTYQKVSSN